MVESVFREWEAGWYGGGEEGRGTALLCKRGANPVRKAENLVLPGRRWMLFDHVQVGAFGMTLLVCRSKNACKAWGRDTKTRSCQWGRRLCGDGSSRADRMGQKHLANGNTPNRRERAAASTSTLPTTIRKQHHAKSVWRVQRAWFASTRGRAARQAERMYAFEVHCPIERGVHARGRGAALPRASATRGSGHIAIGSVPFRWCAGFWFIRSS